MLRCRVECKGMYSPRIGLEGLNSPSNGNKLVKWGRRVMRAGRSRATSTLSSNRSSTSEHALKSDVVYQSQVQGLTLQPAGSGQTLVEG